MTNRSDVGWDLDDEQSSSSQPTASVPLGVIYPGITWTGERNEPNWVC
jgi:hypothetical protein